MSIRALAEADAACGAKALGLARLIAAGQPVPDGFVLESSVFHEVAGLAATGTELATMGTELATMGSEVIGHELAEAEQRIARAEIPAELDREVRRRAAALGRLAVRSSASLEDGEHGSAAGVFASQTDVAPDDVWQAIRAVWTSALTPLAAAYARRRASSIAIAVIVQRFVRGPRVTVYTRPVGAPGGDELWLQRGDRLERAARTSRDSEARLAIAAEAAIAARDGADVELVNEATQDGPRTWIVQARPIVHPARRTRRTPPPIIVAALASDGRRWTWDIAHNPDPLSPAQAGLVEQIDRAAWSPYAMQVCGGYLYTTPRGPRIAPAAPSSAAELTARIAEIEARFVLGRGVESADSVALAVERYVAFMRIWTCELSPLVAAARARLVDQVARVTGAIAGDPSERSSALAAALIGPRRVLRDRVMSPAWDVAVPTFAERARFAALASAAHEPLEPVESVEPDERRTPYAPHAPHAPHARHSSGPSHGPQPALPSELAGIAAAEIELARAAADAAERDDIWFARAQWMVRRALLAAGAALALRGDDIFWLPLDEVITLRTLDPDDAHRRASAARAAHARAAGWDMPLVVHGDATLAMRSQTTLRGVGIGPRVVGRVVRLASLGADTLIGRGDVVVARAITPALAMALEGCAALVSETGGLLDHGAALARELGITCVVGCAGAWTQLSDGMLVSVDGDAGRIDLAQA
jgi:phosphohistidine swiveling domain-containing protein